jgi:CHAT domain-containing protein/Tfp pilus assembly protein PilF
LRAVRCLVLIVLASSLALGAPSAAVAQSAGGSGGRSSLDEAKRLHAEVDDLINHQGRYAEAVALAERELRIRETGLRGDDPLLAEALHDLAEAEAQAGEFAKAEPLYRRALAIYEKKPGEQRLLLARVLDDFASALTNMQRLDEAEGLLGRALAMAEQASGAEGAKLLAETLSNQAGLHYFKGNYDEAAGAFRRALEATEKAVGPDDPLVATVAGNLASVLDRLGRGAEAEPLHRRALAIREKAYGPDHPLVALSLSNMGALALDAGDVVKATELHQRALAIREKALGPDHPDVGVSLNNLAQAYELRGDKARAKALYQRALGLFERALGPDHPRTATVLHNYAGLLVTTDDPAAAEALARLMALQKRQDPRVFDLRSLDTSLWIAQLGLLAGVPRDARELAQQVLARLEPKLGPGSTRAAQCLAVIAESYQREGDLRRADEVFGRAVDLAQQAYGPSHEQLARLLARHAALLVQIGSASRALPLATRAGDIDELNLHLILGAGSESQKRAYAAASASHAEELVSLHVVGAPRDRAATRFALLTVLRRKGCVLDALVDGVGALRRRLSAQDAALLDELASLRSKLARSLTTPAESSEDEHATSAAQQRAEELESRISERSTEFRAAAEPVTLAAVQAAIPDGAALVELFWLRPQAKLVGQPARYVAYVLEHAGEPAWIDLGEAGPIDQAAAALRAALRDPRRADAADLGRKLDEMVMRPVRGMLGGARRILLSPDGALSLVPFGALVDENGRYLLETLAVSYLVSGRDLLRMRSHAPARSPELVVADPDFGARGPRAPEAHGARGGPSLARASFGRLDGTGREGAAIAALLPGATVLTGSRATEQALKQAHGPRILHVATHGFFLEDAGTARVSARALELAASAPAPGQGHEPNPLLFSGLALAQANARPAEGEDGILTALEASGLDLWGTKLVVLSACDTGLGQLDQGEGVSGLRRALFTAGAESAIMSLWKVDDAATRDLMIGIYQRLGQGGGRADSLREAQLALAHEPRTAHPFFWAGFVAVGDFTSLGGQLPPLPLDAERVAPGARGCACEMPAPAPRPSWPLGVAGVALGALRAGSRRGRRRRA